jgi:hypothetical protein
MTDIMTKAQYMVAAIRNGEMDTGLSTVADAVRARQQWLDRQKAAENTLTMPVGTRVIITEPIRPKYLADILGVVSTYGTRKPGYLWVDVDQKWKHRLGRYMPHLHIPASCLRLAGEDEV